MTLRVDWLEAPLVAEADVARCAGDDLTWIADPVRDDLVIGFGCALDGSQAAAAGLASLAAASAANEVDAHAEPGATVAHGGALWIGIGPFDPARASGGVWGEVPAARWGVPQVAFRVHDGHSVCAVAGARDAGEARRLRDLALARIAAPGEEPLDLGALRIRPEEPPASFRARVADAVRAIRRGDLQKVVLARACHAQAEVPFDPARVIRRLARSEPNAVRFSFPVSVPPSFELGAGRMLGATPERLVRIERDRVFADAVAGSAARDLSPALDAELAAGLIDSKKDQEEHAWVRDAIYEALSSRVAELWAAEAPQVLSTGGLHHLHTPFRGLRSRGSVLELAAAMQPTPAVGGAPTAAALQWLREREPLARGCYAGPFGWTGRDGEGALAVALRSALLRGSEAFVFAGAGIVADSDPEAELEETRLKMRTVLDALMEV